MIKTSFFLPLFTIFLPALCQSVPSFTSRGGEWRLLQASIGISPMHMQLLHDNKVIMFDRTDFGPSNLSFSGNRCRFDPSDEALPIDCTAHSVLYDGITNEFRPLMVETDTWCSSGAVLPDGTLVQTGGYNDGDHAVRRFTPCTDDSCDWIEFPKYLSERRWYATNQILPDGRIIIVGGRRQFNYEFYPNNNGASSSSPRILLLPFLIETRDADEENNLYPFVHLLPDGNLFIFANTRSILLDYKRNQVVKEFPSIPDAIPRNYPCSGSSVLLPLNETSKQNNGTIDAEIMICGGAPKGSYVKARNGTFVRTIGTCGRLKVTDEKPSWEMEEMPMPRVMGDMLILPTGDILIINGAGEGTAGWECSQSPVTRPLIYYPNETPDKRFSVMSSSQHPRLYHSAAVLLADGRILIGGSNPHVHYNFTGVNFPTDLSLESFSPPYMAAEYDAVRPRIFSVNENLGYGEFFEVVFLVDEYLASRVWTVRIVAPPFTTHSLAMNQRMVVLKLIGVSRVGLGMFRVAAMAPSAPEISPPGYYLLFVVHDGVPSSGTWVKIQ